MRLDRFAMLLTAGVLAFGVAACGDDDDGGGGDGGATPPAATAPEEQMTTQTESEAPESAAAGKSVFTERCAGCHTLADAQANGTVGPNLDEVALEEEQVVEQVRNGGGGMPAFRDSLSEEQIQAVAQYVTEVGGS